MPPKKGTNTKTSNANTGENDTETKKNNQVSYLQKKEFKIFL